MMTMMMKRVKRVKTSQGWTKKFHLSHDGGANGHCKGVQYTNLTSIRPAF